MFRLYFLPVRTHRTNKRLGVALRPGRYGVVFMLGLTPMALFGRQPLSYSARSAPSLSMS